MSLIHRALDQPNLPQGGQGTDYNPLSRQRKAINRFWWSLTLIALLASLVVLGSHWLTRKPTPPDTSTTQPLTRQGPSPADQVAAIEVPSVSREPSAGKTSSVGKEPSAGTEPPAGNERSAVNQPAIEQDQTLAAQTSDLAPTPKVGKGPAPRPETAVNPADTSGPATAENQKGVRSGAGELKRPVKTASALAPNDVQPVSRPAPEVAEHRASETTPSRSDTEAKQKQNEARSASQTPVRITRPGPEQRELAVQEALNRDQIQKAESLLTVWISESPQAALPRVWLAKIHLTNHRFEEAEALLDGVTTVEALGLRGLLLEKTERYGRAATLFEHLARTEPDNPQWWLHWAINQENNGRLAQARLLYQTYLEEFSAYNASLTAFASQRYQALEK